ncbi:MAG TPA: septum formation initiator family protein [Rhizomicrobium sp.]|nr:septum formation initiator family protein [Rhizomicrobium sp.]
MLRTFSLPILPAITYAVVAYFGYYAIWGDRGLIAFQTTEAQLDVQKEQLAQADAIRSRLQHRISLMDAGDPDLVEELQRTQLMEGSQGVIGVTRPRN